MNLATLKPAKGSRKTKHRVGRGQGSGWGKTAGKGSKGHQSRSGFSYGVSEGGQMPLHRRLPKFGFTPPSREEYRTVSLGQLNEWATNKKLVGDATLEALNKLGVSSKREHIKVLSDGELTVKLNVFAHAFSEAAKEKIEKAGGTATLAVRTLNEAKTMKEGDKPMEMSKALALPKKKLKRGVRKGETTEQSKARRAAKAKAAK